MVSIAWGSSWEASIAWAKTEYYNSLETMPKYIFPVVHKRISGTLTGLLYECGNCILVSNDFRYCIWIIDPRLSCNHSKFVYNLDFDLEIWKVAQTPNMMLVSSCFRYSTTVGPIEGQARSQGVR